MKLHKRYLAMWRSIRAEDDANVLLNTLFRHTGAVYMSEYGFGKVMVELGDGKRFYGSSWHLSSVRELYGQILRYKRKKGWKP